MAPTAPPRFDAPVESPEELARHTPVTPPADTAPPPPPQGEVELVGRVDHSLLDALLEMHNPTGGEAGGSPPAGERGSARMMENP